jgi:hypothetical protein
VLYAVLRPHVLQRLFLFGDMLAIRRSVRYDSQTVLLAVVHARFNDPF